MKRERTKANNIYEIKTKKWAPETIARHPGTALNLDSLNNLPEFSYLEIGSGKGRFLLTMAKNNPSRKYLGIEMNYNAFSLAIKLSEDPLFAEFDNRNYAFINAPCERVFEKIKPESLDCIYLNFSDPWPRKREHKRRLTYPTLLNVYLNLLKKDGMVAFKTDNVELYEDSTKYFSSVVGFDVIFEGEYKEEALDDVMTEFEQKFREQGKPIFRIIAKKK